MESPRVTQSIAKTGGDLEGSLKISGQLLVATAPSSLLNMSALEAMGLVASFILGILFIYTGFLKLRDGPAWPRQASDMGVGRSLALVVPWVELLLGVAIVSQLFRPWAAVAGGLLLVAFTALIGIRLLDESRPPCACFGSKSNRPLSARHLLRNLVLLAVAALAVRYN